MSAVVLDKEYTPEDLLAMSDGPRYELFKGRLVEKSIGAKASLIAMTVVCLLGEFTRPKRLGLVFGSDCGYQCFATEPKRVVFPDASFIRLGRLPNDEPPDGHVRIAPDLVLEVVSPSNWAADLMQKILDYLQAGVRLVWVVFPQSRTVLVFRPNHTVSLLTPGNELSGEGVIPGFACRVAEVFEAIPAEPTNHASS
ncbi:MAG TPA: Uma2 family endonuclease [Gemmataceae bacterium]|nr:Uma2 family endonuclease [Gemmataceae bacterium]